MECENKTAHESFVSLLLRLQKEGSMPIPLTNETIIALMFVSFLTLSPPSPHPAGTVRKMASLSHCFVILVIE